MKSLNHTECQLLEKHLPHLFGHNLVILGEHGCYATALLKSPIIKKTILSSPNKNPMGHIVTDYKQLPLQKDSVDVFIIPHILEFEKKPNKILEQAVWALRPHGTIILFCFNLFGLYNLKELNKNFYTTQKLKKSLGQLDCEIITNQTYHFSYDINKKAKNNNFLDIVGSQLWPGFGNSHFVLAKKTRHCVTPMRKRWLSSRVPIGENICDPTS